MASVKPENYVISYNSTFKTEIFLQGLPFYQNPDFQILDWRTDKSKTFEGLAFVEIADGYFKVVAQYSSYSCSNTGIHRLSVELVDYSQFVYELSSPLFISGKNTFPKAMSHDAIFLATFNAILHFERCIIGKYTSSFFY